MLTNNPVLAVQAALVAIGVSSPYSFPADEPALSWNVVSAVSNATQLAVVVPVTGVPLVVPIPYDTISVVRFCTSKLIYSIPPSATKASHCAPVILVLMLRSAVAEVLS